MYFLRCLAAALLAAATLGTVTGCDRLLSAMTSSTSVKPASHYFSGPTLDAARGIERDDLAPLAALSATELAAPGREQMSLMWWALMRHKPAAVRELVARGVDPDSQIVEGMGSALFHAFVQQDPVYLQAMLDGGLSPDHQGKDQLPMLKRALLEGHPAHLRLLIERGANVNVRDSLGGTALTTAIRQGNVEAIDMFMARGADLNVQQSSGISLAWTVYLTLEDARLPPPALQAIDKLRERMIAQGIEWPPESPTQWRARHVASPIFTSR
ncbi:MAG: ankyrin repeat domain-containing protein [Pseudomonadota bacterium]|nr:ankyrin repeat domain-containing protein [Pseudomonadota bacterium]